MIGQIQCCGLLLMAVMFYFYKTQKTIKLKTERAFWHAFLVTSASIVLDILSCIVIINRDVLPELIVEGVSKIYLASMVVEAFFALLYICTDIYPKKNQYNKMMIRYGIFVVCAVLLILVLPISFYYDKETGVLYSYGLSDYVTYAFAFATMIILNIRLFIEKDKISKDKRKSVRVWMVVWCLAAIIQFFNPKLLLIGFGCALGMLVLYLKLENPGNNLDKQTGMFNHGAFLQYTKQLYDTDIPFAVLDISLEYGAFKAMSTELTEEVISQVAGYLSKINDAIAFKNTGSEIIMVFPKKETAEQTVKEIYERFEYGWGKNKGILISPALMYISDSSLTDNSEDLLYLIRYVRHNSKELNENRFVSVSEELAAELYKEKEIEQLIVNAINNDWVEVWYQPIYSTKLHRFTSAEALVRIRSDDGILVQPGSFIGIAERNGMILQLGEIVFRKVCRFLNENNVQQYGVTYIEVNLSMVQCAYNQLAKDYISIMKEYGIPPEMINLEITESASTNAKKTLLDNMKELMDYGVNFSLDDFGTGQSNLDYIADMPVDIVKFDRGMTNAYFENGKAKYIMDAAMNMIQGMDLKIVSEGIETEEQFKTMDNLGINYIQGYYFSKPLPEKEYLEFIKNREADILTK